jgi:hypothetical protein
MMPHNVTQGKFLDLFNQSILDKGISTGGSITTLTDPSKNWEVDIWAGSKLFLLINGQIFTRYISSNTFNTLTFDTLPVSVQVFSGVPYTIYSIEIAEADIHELAARLGSPVTYDRRGDVVWMADFEDGLTMDLQWSFLSTFLLYYFGTFTNAADILSLVSDVNNDGVIDAIDISIFTNLLGGTVTRSTLAMLSKVASAKLVTSAASIGRNASIGRSIPYLSNGRVGFNTNILFGLAQSVADAQVIVLFSQYTGVQWVYGGIVFDGGPNPFPDPSPDYAVSIIGPGGTLYPIKTMQMMPYVFHNIKLVLNLADRKYSRLIIDNIETNLPQYGLEVKDYVNAGGSMRTPPSLTVDVILRTKVAAARTIYVDNNVITQNEPSGNSAI